MLRVPKIRFGAWAGGVGELEGGFCLSDLDVCEGHVYAGLTNSDGPWSQPIREGTGLLSRRPP